MRILHLLTLVGAVILMIQGVSVGADTLENVLKNADYVKIVISVENQEKASGIDTTADKTCQTSRIFKIAVGAISTFLFSPFSFWILNWKNEKKITESIDNVDYEVLEIDGTKYVVVKTADDDDEFPHGNHQELGESFL
ncbi:Protein CBG27941 [Caenorhabditis briggsae]|uniref:Protein CBG27941 n=1 Tax=Caenorhabditis briggsae TaxID=6238 RepID=B6IJN3_CAEBR|nr:Protein CBG27941 [Caenorhabditis briggsae]CAS00113.1 Protein CBG27941 [Caenorhabditis briggsae]